SPRHNKLATGAKIKPVYVISFGMMWSFKSINEQIIRRQQKIVYKL
ncbi:hypothetical protein LCGC14_2552580, partial [marine sediment metagenome]